MYPVAAPFGHKSGSLIRSWSKPRIEAAIDETSKAIRGALHRGDMETALTLVSKNVGLRICAGQIKVVLRPPIKLGPPQARSL